MASALQKRVWGWMAFDWATQPFYTLGLTFIFGPYFAGVVTETLMADGMAENAADARAQSLWALGQTMAGLIIAFSGPVLGAYADSTGRRMPWIVGFSLVYVVTTALLWQMTPDGAAIWFCLYVFVIGFIAAEFALIFVNAQLPSLGGEEAIGKISGTGASVGYWGGVLSLFIMLLFFFESDAETGTTLLGHAPALGLNPETREGTRIVGPFIALWFVIFMIPYFLWVREPAPVVKQGGMKQALGDLWTSLKGIAHRDSLKGFLLSSMFYRDALNALYGFGGVYAKLVLNWSLTQIAVFGIIGAVTAGVATWVGGKLDARYGPRPVIIGSIFILIAVCVVIVGMTREFVFFISLGPESRVPDTLFYICGACIGGAGGTIYASSRSMMVRHTHPDRPTEAFGLFALSGKATAFLAPALILTFTELTGSPRLGIAPVILLFMIGLVLLVFVNKDGDRAAWADTSSSHSA